MFSKPLRRPLIKSQAPKKIFLVNRDLQLRYVGYAVIVGLLSTLITGFVILYPLYAFEILRIPQFLPLPFLIAMGLIILVNIFLISSITFLITHKIAGPLFALVRSMNVIERGLWNEKLRLRQDDELHYVARNFNGMVDSIVGLTKNDVQLNEKMLEQLSEIEKLCVAENKPMLRNKIVEIVDLAKQGRDNYRARLGIADGRAGHHD